MILRNIGIIASETSRSHIYLKKLIDSELIPNYCIYLENLTNETLPGQLSHNQKKLTDILNSNNISFTSVNSTDINSEKVYDALMSRSEEVFIYSGYGGAILREKILNSGKKFLHIHGGYLPDYKGSTCNYYSFLNDKEFGASSIFLSEKIDSGPILFRKKFIPPSDLKSVDHEYDSEIRSEVLIETLKKYIHKKIWSFDLNTNSAGETYYIIHPLLKHIAYLKR